MAARRLVAHSSWGRGLPQAGAARAVGCCREKGRTRVVLRNRHLGCCCLRCCCYSLAMLGCGGLCFIILGRLYDHLYQT